MQTLEPLNISSPPER